MEATTNTNLDGPRSAIKFAVGDRETGACFYSWRLWADGSSFYMKSCNPVMAAWKISLHGLDPNGRHQSPGFKVGPTDEHEQVRAVDAGAIANQPLDAPCLWFVGNSVATDVVHAVRYRATWDLRAAAIPTLLTPPPLDEKRQIGVIVPMPKPLRPIDLDLFVSGGAPYWPNEAQARRDNACIGPLKNRVGEYLTGVVSMRNAIRDPAPIYTRSATVLSPDHPRGKEFRGVGVAVGGDGVLWVVEQLLRNSG